MIEIISKSKKILDDKFDDIKYFLKNIKYEYFIEPIEGIKNFWKYKKVIYRDRWYDYSFLIDLLEVKIKDMRDNWKYAHYVDSEKEQETLNTLCNLIDEYNYINDNCIQKDCNELMRKFFIILSENYDKFWD